MMLQDVHGHELTGATEEAAAHFERGTHELRCFIGDPVASADRAIAAAPDFVMAHALKGYLYGLSTEAGAQPVVETCHAAASRVAATPRERGHVAALGHLAQGRWHEAGKVLADLADAYPRDALGAACSRPCHGDAVPAAGWHRMDAREHRKMDKRQLSAGP